MRISDWSSDVCSSDLQHAPRGGFQIAGDHFHDGGLAGAVMAEQADNLVPADLEGNILDGGDRAVAAHESVGNDHLAGPETGPLAGHWPSHSFSLEAVLRCRPVLATCDGNALYWYNQKRESV